MFLKRSYQKEIMDDFSINDEIIYKALKELKIINKYLGGNSATKKGIKLLLKNGNNSGIKILDIGGGASDNLLSQKDIYNYKIFSLDINKAITNYIIKNSAEISAICSNIFHPSVKNKSLDIVHASLFLHHFNEEEIKIILTKIKNISKKGLIINDLQRSIFALAGIKILTALFSRSVMVKNDAPLSVKKGFTKKELIEILEELNLNYYIKWRWAFRWLIVIYI